MSKSLRRVRAALEAAGLPDTVLEMPGETRTAAQAARAAGCGLDQIAKSIVFVSEAGGLPLLFLTAGGNQVDPAKAAAVAGAPLARADAGVVRTHTGFAIGGVAPIGLISPIPAFFDPRLHAFPTVWAAAGTPRHIFSIDPEVLQKMAGAGEADFTR